MLIASMPCEVARKASAAASCPAGIRKSDGRGTVSGGAGKSFRRRVIEAPPRAGQGADRAWAVVRLIDRGRAAGRVIAGPVLHFENDGRVPFGEVSGNRGTGNAGADHQDLGVMGRHGCV